MRTRKSHGGYGDDSEFMKSFDEDQLIRAHKVVSVDEVVTPSYVGKALPSPESSEHNPEVDIHPLMDRVSVLEDKMLCLKSDMNKLRDHYEPKDFRGLLQNSPKWIQKTYFPARAGLAVSIAGILTSWGGGNVAQVLEWNNLAAFGQAVGSMCLGTAIASALLSWLTRPRKEA